MSCVGCEPTALSADSLRAGDLVAIPIRDRIVNTATIDAITHASRQLPLAAEEFLRFLQGELQNLREPLNVRRVGSRGMTRWRSGGPASSG